LLMIFLRQTGDQSRALPYLAQRRRRHSEPLHRRRPNPTFRDGHHRRCSNVL